MQLPWQAAVVALWAIDCFRWRRRILAGCFAHWCDAWDGLPVDETCSEHPCECWR